jgi:hypothetical protein
MAKESWAGLKLLLDVHRQSTETMKRVLNLDDRMARKLTQELIIKSLELAFEGN